MGIEREFESLASDARDVICDLDLSALKALRDGFAKDARADRSSTGNVPGKDTRGLAE
jgi:hypothetical protein